MHRSLVILRLIVDKPMEAKEYLTSKGFVVRVSEVLGAELEDKKGTLNNMLTILAEGKININYIYSFIIRDGLAPVMVFHTDDFDKAIESLKNGKREDCRRKRVIEEMKCDGVEGKDQRSESGMYEQG